MKHTISIALDDEQISRYNEWITEQNLKAVEKQKKEISNPSPFVVACWKEGYPYTGASGGGITYSITPTGIGTVIKVRYEYLNSEIDLTDYDNW